MKKNSPKTKYILEMAALLIVMVLIGLTVIFGIGQTKTGAAKNIKLGLDLAGGVSITYEVASEEYTQADIDDTVYKLQLRVQNYSTEADVYQEGSNRINVEIPGVTDANAILQELGKPGSLIFVDVNGNVVMTGSDVEDAQAASYNDPVTGLREYIVSLVLTESGKQAFAEATAAAVENQDYIMIIYDNMIISAPTVQSAITDGRCQITGMPDFDTAANLASTIRIGSLPLELRELRSNVVGAKLGEEAISTSLLAGLIGFILVVVFMVAAYRISGVASGIALTLYVGLMLGLLNAFDLTLTLPGIAGIILSIGMAVDANVIIYARIKEELAAGKTVQSAIKVGFNKAMSAIIDGNVTTIIAALVLMYKGSGTIRGFAQTLLLGIVLSMFTALVISRFVMYVLYNLGFQDVKWYGIQRERKTINFVKPKNLFFGISAAVIILGLCFTFVNRSAIGGALNYSIEFAGGTSTNVTFNEDYSLADFESTILPVVTEATGDATPQIQKIEGSMAFIIKTKELTTDVRESLNQALAEKFGVDVSLITSETISPSISSEMKSDAVTAVIIATILMLLYIWIRFSDIKFAASAVVALLHDVLIVFGFYAVSRIAVGNTFIACMLTIVGYSINATIVIFDRIRENLAENKGKLDYNEIVNRSITQTLTRSIYTSWTTFVMVLILYIMGVAAIKEFALPLMVGIICGAYSSVCITGSLWLTMKKVWEKYKK
ncbi:MAG: protein translocase subunit SecD [Lachnospiraceae bacterium]|nr:protein translocase subunit SecD [Lachnospiraceae bacterium]